MLFKQLSIWDRPYNAKKIDAFTNITRVQQSYLILTVIYG